MLQLDINQAADYAGCSANTVRKYFIKQKDEINKALGYSAVEMVSEGNTRKYYISRDAIDHILALTKSAYHLPLTKQENNPSIVVEELVAMLKSERKKYEELERRYQILYNTLEIERKQHKEFAESMARTRKK